MERYDPVANTWTLVAPMPEAKSQMGVAVLDGLVYVIGGVWGNRKSVYRYVPASESWTAMAPLKRSLEFRSRSSVGLFML